MSLLYAFSVLSIECSAVPVDGPWVKFSDEQLLPPTCVVFHLTAFYLHIHI
jgi:hypothetical protein